MAQKGIWFETPQSSFCSFDNQTQCCHEIEHHSEHNNAHRMRKGSATHASSSATLGAHKAAIVNCGTRNYNIDMYLYKRVECRTFRAFDTFAILILISHLMLTYFTDYSMILN